MSDGQCSLQLLFTVFPLFRLPYVDYPGRLLPRKFKGNASQSSRGRWNAFNFGSSSGFSIAANITSRCVIFIEQIAFQIVQTAQRPRFIVPIRPPSPHYVFPDEIYQYDHTKPPTTDYGSRPFPSPTEKEALFNDPFLGSGARHHMPPYKPLRRNHFASNSSPLPFLYQSGLMRSRPVYRYAPVGQDSMQEHGFFRANVHRDTSAAYVRKVYPFAAEPAMHEQTYDTDEHPAKKKRKTTNSVLLNHSAETNKDHTTDLHGPARGFLSPPTFSEHPSEQVSEEESSFRIYKVCGVCWHHQVHPFMRISCMSSAFGRL